MPIAYVDSSTSVAVIFGEPAARKVALATARYTRLVSSNLLESEVRSALQREHVSSVPAMFSGIDWIYPNRPLTAEFERVLALGPLRGADLWHVACALFLDPTATELAFITLDQPQRRIAAALGFNTP